MSFLGGAGFVSNQSVYDIFSYFNGPTGFTRDDLKNKYINNNITSDEVKELIDELENLVVQEEIYRDKNDKWKIGKPCIYPHQFIDKWPPRYWYTFACHYPDSFEYLLKNLTDFSRAAFLDNFTSSQIHEFLQVRLNKEIDLIMKYPDLYENGCSEDIELIELQKKECNRIEQEYIKFYRPAMTVARKLREKIPDVIYDWLKSTISSNSDSNEGDSNDAKGTKDIEHELYRVDVDKDDGHKIIDFLRKAYEDGQFDDAIDNGLKYFSSYEEKEKYSIDAFMICYGDSLVLHLNLDTKDENNSDDPKGDEENRHDENE